MLVGGKMKKVFENPPLSIELVNYWPPGKWQCILDVHLGITAFGTRLFYITIMMYRNPFDFELEFTLFGFGIEIANCE